MADWHLDAKDKILIQALRRNARASLVALARNIELSRSATHDRIVKLEERGVIQRYTIEVAHDVLPLVRAFMSVQFENDFAQTKLVDIIHAIDGVEAAYCLSGDIDMLVYCECHTAEQLAALRDQVAAFEGVISVRTRHVMATSRS